MTHEAGAANIQSEQAPDLSAISPEVIAAGGRLGMTAAGIAGMHQVEPTSMLKYAQLQPPPSDVERANFERVGTLAYHANEFTRGLIARLWKAPHAIDSIEAAAVMGADPAYAFLEGVSHREAEYLCGAAALQGGGRAFDTNLRMYTALARAGALQLLYKESSDGHRAKGDVLAAASWKDTRPTDEEYAAYCSCRELLAEVAADPRFARYAATEFGANTMSLFLLRFVHAGKSEEELRHKIESFLTFISDDQNAAALENIAATKPALLDFLNPMTSDYSAGDMAEHCRELAAAQSHTLPKRLINMVANNRDATQKMLFARICADTLAFQFSRHSTDWSAFFEAAVPWTLNGAETVEEKKRLLQDPAFITGLANAGTNFTRDRLERIRQRQKDEPLLGLLEELYGTDSPEYVRIVYGRETTEHTVAIFRDFYDKFGLDCYDLLARWEETGRTKDETMQHVRRNMQVMRTLEEQAPEEGVCRWLRQERQFRNFGRYGANVLLEQWRSRNTEDACGIGLFAVKDTNTALYTAASEYLDSVVSQLDDENVRLQLYEAATPREALIALSRARRKYGQLHFGYLAVHGMDQIDGVIWGSRNGEVSYPEDLFAAITDNTYTLPDSNLTGLGRVFVPGAPIAANTCYGAREGRVPAIARTWAVATGATVHASAGSSSLPSVDIHRWPDGLLDISAHFASGGRNVTTVIFEGALLRRDPTLHDVFTFEIPSNSGADEVTQKINQVISTMGKDEAA